jgi:hypothetical protein
MMVQESPVASFNELAAYFRQRQATADGDRWYGASWYEGGIDQWIQWPEWLNPRCDDRYSALDAGRCCRDSGNTVVRLALNLADMAQDMLGAFDRGDRQCAAAVAELAPLVDAAPQSVAAIRAALAGADRVLAVQLGCALDRISLVTGRLAVRRRCPWRCARHGHPDRGADLAALRQQIGECSGAIWDALHPRLRVRM